jgi:hypothetical protein
MKESRADAFSTFRNIPMEKKVSCSNFFDIFHFSLQKNLSTQHLLNTIVREELAQEIDNDIVLQEIIMKEILENWEEWQNEEFERSMESMIETEDQCQIFCPVCERNLLNLKENIISCLCGLR